MRPRSAPNCATYTNSTPAGHHAIPGDRHLDPVSRPGRRHHPRALSGQNRYRLTHTFPRDLDVYLIAPGGNTVGLFTDVGELELVTSFA